MAFLTFYGGVGEIGGNKILLEDQETRIFLDFGMGFDRRADFYEEYLQPRTNNSLRDLLELGIAPRIDGIYRDDLLKADRFQDIMGQIGCDDRSLWVSEVMSYNEVAQSDGRPFIRGVLISHGHMDHFQYISLLDEKIPIYCSDITRIIVEVAQAVSRGGLECEFTVANKRALSSLGPSSYFPGAYTINTKSVSRTFVQLAERLRIGQIEVRSFPVDHSVPGAVAFLITTSDGKTIVYTGDLRFHGSRSHLTESFRSNVRGLRPDALITEGTRVEEDTPDSESSVEERCLDLVSGTRGLAMVGFAWKDITRYHTMKRVAERANRTLVISPKLAFLLNRLKHVEELDITEDSSAESVRVYLKRKDSMLYSKADYVASKHDVGYSVAWDRSDPSTIDLEHFSNGIRAYEIKQDPSRYLLHLDYYDFNELIDLNPSQGSTYIRASSEPFNDEMRLDEERLRRWLYHFDINAPSHEPHYVHASGHASGPELEQLIGDIGPKVVYPVHTQHPELFCGMVPASTKVLVPEEGKTYAV